MHSSTGIRRFAGLFVGGLLAALATGAMSESAVTPGSKAAGMESCVEPTAEMRRNHMDYLKHERVGTVHQGIRGRKHSLAGCVDCHSAKGDAGGYKPVNGEGEFCDGCHTFVAVNIYCFQCHRKIPDGVTGAAQPHAGKDMGDLSGDAVGLLPGAGKSPAMLEDGS